MDEKDIEHLELVYTELGCFRGTDIALMRDFARIIKELKDRLCDSEPTGKDCIEHLQSVGLVPSPTRYKLVIPDEIKKGYSITVVNLLEFDGKFLDFNKYPSLLVTFHDDEYLKSWLIPIEDEPVTVAFKAGEKNQWINYKELREACEDGKFVSTDKIRTALKNLKPLHN